MPPSASTRRSRIYCTPACRKAAYEQRRARKPDATIVKVVVEHHETIVDKGHGIGTCQFLVAQSPRVCTLIVQHLAGLARKNELLDNNEGAPTVRAIEDLFAAITGPPPRRYR